MKKIILVLTLILLALFSIACVCAGDMNDTVISNQDDSQIELTVIKNNNIELNIDENQAIGEKNPINEEDNGTFTALQQKINNAGDNYTIIFANNYTYDNGFTANGILINKSLTIDGKGYTINASHQSRIFNIVAANVTLKNISFINGNASCGGAIIWNHADNGKITDCLFENNEAQDGGAIFWDNATEGKIIKSTFKNNNVTWRGGAIQIVNASTCKINDCTFDNNNANRSAGAIYVNNCTYISIDNSKFENNQVNYSGGAIYFNGDNGAISNSNFTNNNARFNGAVCINGENGNVNNCIFTNNIATESAGALGWERKGNGNIEKCTFTTNTAPMGGAIYQNSATNISISNSIFENNTANDGGAIFWDNGTEGKIIKSTFKNNNVTWRGGAIQIVNASTCKINDCTFDNNNANRSAGAIYVNNCTYISIDNSKFENNQVNYSGGAIYFNGDNGAISNSNFTNNNARFNGAVCINGENGNVNNCIFTNNIATESAGALGWERKGNGNIEKCTFTTNTAPMGGAIYQNSATNISISNSIFENNTANDGGAIFWDNGTEGKIIKSTFKNNKADGFGGAIYNNATTIINNSKFTANNATKGNAIETESDMIISNSEFIGNGEDCIDVKSGAQITLNNVSSDVPLVNDTISMAILEAKDVIYGNDINIKVRVNSSIISPLNNGKVVVKVNNVEYSVDVKDGIATLVIPELDVGTYNVNVVYIDNNMSRAEIPVNFTVNKRDITINANDAAYIINYGGTYKVSFTNVVDGTKVTFTLNGKNIGTSAIINGAASIKLTAKILKTAKAGKKNMIIKIENSNYSLTSKTVKITINKEKTKIIAKKKTFKKSTKTKKYTIILKNSKGNAVNKAKVTLKVKGKTYRAKTNTKGKAVFKIKKLTKKGKYTATVKYAGSAYYNAVSKKVKIIIK